MCRIIEVLVRGSNSRSNFRTLKTPSELPAISSPKRDPGGAGINRNESSLKAHERSGRVAADSGVSCLPVLIIHFLKNLALFYVCVCVKGGAGLNVGLFFF